MKRKLFRWEMAGIAIIGLAGSLLHFLFELAGEWPPVGAIAAVNESVWEHLKLAFWPAVLYGAIEYRYLPRQYTSNFGVAKAIGIILMPVLIMVLFYSYTAILEDSLAIDITIFWVAVAAGQFVSYRLLLTRYWPGWPNLAGYGLLAALGVIFIVFTYYPPHLSIFQDSLTGGYGLPE